MKNLQMLGIMFLCFSFILGACHKNSNPTQPQSSRVLHEADTVTIFEYHNWQGTGMVAHQNFVFGNLPDTLNWTELSADYGYAWLYSEWIVPGSPQNQWEFAFPGVTQFGDLKAPDSY